MLMDVKVKTDLMKEVFHASFMLRMKSGLIQ